MTENLIKSLKNTIYPQDSEFSEYKIIIIETQKNCQFKYENVITIDYEDQTFNYNKALNIGKKYCYDNTDWFCFMNNDMLCDMNWIVQISKAVQEYPDLISVCPGGRLTKNKVDFGYTLFRHMFGFCFLANKKVFDVIGDFDQTFDFYFQDDDYIEQVREHGLRHASVKNSIVRHFGNKTSGNDRQKLLQKNLIDKQKFIGKYGYETYSKRCKQKQAVKRGQDVEC